MGHVCKETRVKRCGWIAAGLAFVTAFALSMESAATVESMDSFFAAFREDVIHLLSLFLFFLLYSAAAKYVKKRRLAVSAVTGCLLALCVVWGISAAKYGSILNGAVANVWSIAFFLIQFTGCALAVTALILLVFGLLDTWQNTSSHRLVRGRFFQFTERLLASSRQSFLLVWGLLMVAWLPYLIAVFPGSVDADIISQMFMGLGHAPLTAHHPPLMTWLVTAAMRAAGALTGSYYAGVAFVTLCQFAATAAIFSYCLSYMARLAFPILYRLLCLVLFAVHPQVAYGAVSLLKDYWQAPVTLLYLLLYVEVLRTGRVFFSSRYRVAAFVAASLLMAFFKKTGVYFFLLSVLVLFALAKGYRKQLAGMAGTVLLVILLVEGPLYTALGIEPGNPREMLSIPTVQVAKVVAAHGESLREEDRALIDTVLPYDELPQRYANCVHFGGADYVKMEFDTDVFREDKLAYVKLWARLGLAYPKDYFEALLVHSSGYWNPTGWNTETFNKPYDYYLQAYNIDSALDPSAATYTPRQNPGTAMQAVSLWVPRLPLVRFFFSIGAQFWLLVLCCAYLIEQKLYRFLLPFTIPLACWLICVASPVNNHHRYAYPALVTVPFLVGYTLYATRKKAEPDVQNP